MAGRDFEMKQGLGLAIALTLAGCTTIQPMTKGSTLVLKTQILVGTHTQTVLNPYDQSAINHLKLELYPLVDGVPQAKITGQTLVNAQLGNPIVFSNLKPNTSYRIQGSAYYSADDSQLISIDASSSTDVVLTNDDRPTVSTLQVALIDRAFNGQATSSLLINSGGYSPLGTESLVIPKLVSTLAGSTSGYLNGVGTSSKFNTPRGLIFDANGILYVADTYNNVIRTVSPLGVVATFVGSGSAGIQDGTGTNALLNRPSALAFDGSGNLYVTEWSNNCIRKVSPAGVVTTLAGTVASGSVDGTGTGAQFYAPMGIVFAPDGFLYVADAYNNRIRKVSTSGVVTTLAGSGSGFADGDGTSAQFSSPHGIAVNPAGELFIGDAGNHRIRKISPTGFVTTFAGSVLGNVDGQGTAACFKSPYAITYVGDGTFYLVDDNSLVRKMDSNGVVTTLAGNGTAAYLDGIGTTSQFKNPRGITVDAYGNIYVSDASNHKIRKLQ